MQCVLAYLEDLNEKEGRLSSPDSNPGFPRRRFYESSKESAEKIASKVAELLEGEVKSLEGDKAKWFEVRGEVKGHSLTFTAFYRY